MYLTQRLVEMMNHNLPAALLVASFAAAFLANTTTANAQRVLWGPPCPEAASGVVAMAPDFYRTDNAALVFAKQLVHKNGDVTGHQIIRCSLTGQAQVVVSTRAKGGSSQSPDPFDPSELVVLDDGSILVRDGQALKVISPNAQEVSTIVGPHTRLSVNRNGTILWLQEQVTQLIDNPDGEIFIATIWRDGAEIRIWKLERHGSQWQAEHIAGGGDTPIDHSANASATVIRLNRFTKLGRTPRGLLLMTVAGEYSKEARLLKLQRDRQTSTYRLTTAIGRRRLQEQGLWRERWHPWHRTTHVTEADNGTIFLLNEEFIFKADPAVDKVHRELLRDILERSKSYSKQVPYEFVRGLFYLATPFAITDFTATGSDSGFVVIDGAILYLASDDAFSEHLKEQTQNAIPPSFFPYGRCEHLPRKICRACHKHAKKCRKNWPLKTQVLNHLKRIAHDKIVTPEAVLALEGQSPASRLSLLPQELRNELLHFWNPNEDAWVKQLRARLAIKQIEHELASRK